MTPLSLSALTHPRRRDHETKATSKILRAALITALLIVGLVAGALDKNYRVEATSCEEAWSNYYNADGTYENARLSYGIPTTCAQDCALAQDPPQCVLSCQSSRATAFN